jgi:hypothetical protein
MKEDVAVMEVLEDLGGSFNELGGSDDVNEEPNGSGIMLSEAVINVFGVLNIKTSGFNKGLVLYFFYDSEVVRRGC